MGGSSVCTMVRSVPQCVAIIDEVHVAEVSVVVGVAIMVGVEGRVLASRSTRLHVGISIGADDKGIIVVEVEAIISTAACNVSSMHMNEKEEKRDGPWYCP